MTNELKINQLYEIIKKSNNIVVLTGAGVSVPSGIPDFRSSTGIYNNNNDKIPPEVILSHRFFINYPDEFYHFYKTKMIYPKALPNIAHKVLTKLEQLNKLNGIITQNIDGLDYDSGSHKVYELHGSVRRNYCMKCNQFYDLEYIIKSNGVPRCSQCSGIIKPDVVLYEESLDYDILEKSIELIKNAYTLIVIGTSLRVNPAASLINFFKGVNFIIVNLSLTPYDKYAKIVINDKIENVFEQIYIKMKELF